MPSGDTAQAANFSLMMFYHIGAPYYFYAWIPIAFARVYFQLHYIGDWLVGAAIGFFVAYVSNMYYFPIQQMIIDALQAVF